MPVIAAVMIAFAFSIVVAGKAESYRRGHRRELQVRRRAEIAVRRLNAQLEQRVLARTAAIGVPAAGVPA